MTTDDWLRLIPFIAAALCLVLAAALYYFHG